MSKYSTLYRPKSRFEKRKWFIKTITFASSFFGYICRLKFIEIRMTVSKHNGFRNRILAIILLFFNCVCVASGSIKNTFEHHNQVMCVQFGNDANNFESEENIVPASSFINRVSTVSVSSKNHIYNQNFYYNAPVLFCQKWRQSLVTEAGFLLKPRYYCFLFRYSLF